MLLIAVLSTASDELNAFPCPWGEEEFEDEATGNEVLSTRLLCVREGVA